MRITLLISTYNWPEALDLVLRSLEEQTVLPDEVLIADDGSGIETREIIKEYQEKFDFPVNHVWHEDVGFRKSIILNKTLAKATGDFIIQLDGDCIMHKKFIEDHILNAKKGSFQFGSRVNIQKKYLSTLFSNKEVKFRFLSEGLSKRRRNIHMPVISKFYKEKKELSNKLRGCNMSYWKEDILKINGYNEDMTGWGKEDSELVVRLLNNRVFGRRLKYSAIVYHIWHEKSSRKKHPVNTSIQQKAIENRLSWCNKGIEKYL